MARSRHPSVCTDASCCSCRGDGVCPRQQAAGSSAVVKWAVKTLLQICVAAGVNSFDLKHLHLNDLHFHVICSLHAWSVRAFSLSLEMIKKVGDSSCAQRPLLILLPIKRFRKLLWRNCGCIEGTVKECRISEEWASLICTETQLSNLIHWFVWNWIFYGLPSNVLQLLFLCRVFPVVILMRTRCGTVYCTCTAQWSHGKQILMQGCKSIKR